METSPVAPTTSRASATREVEERKGERGPVDALAAPALVREASADMPVALSIARAAACMLCVLGREPRSPPVPASSGAPFDVVDAAVVGGITFCAGLATPSVAERRPLMIGGTRPFTPSAMAGYSPARTLALCHGTPCGARVRAAGE